MAATRQMIVIRRDLKMRRGKEIAQGSHSCLAFLTLGIQMIPGPAHKENSGYHFMTAPMSRERAHELQDWFEHSFKKVTVTVNSEEEMLALQKNAEEKGLSVYPIWDSGKTEFHGIKTLTALSIGPHYDEKFVGVTDHLPLY